MAIGPRLRFEVFKRDGFTCRYCGRKTPQVVLEVDHVIPRSKGGEDAIENLMTSCWECNRGKGAFLLSEVPNEPNLHDKAVLLLERELQLAEYNEMKRRTREREDEEIVELHDYWDELANGHARQFPSATAMRRFLRDIPAEDIKDAMEIAMSKHGDWVGCKYLSGILRNWARKEPPPWEREEDTEKGR